MLSNPDYGVSIDETLLIRKYISPDEPGYAELLSISQRVLRLLVAITDYSIEIATLSSIDKTDAEQVNAYADYLQTLQLEIVASLQLPEEDLNDLIQAIRQQQTLLQAIRTAQPIINLLGRFGQLLINDYDSSVSDVATRLDASIEQDFSVLVEFTRRLDQRRRTALAEIAELPDNPSNTDHEKALLARVDRVQDTAVAIHSEIELYWDTHRELDTIYTRTLESSYNVRLILLLWGRGHAALADGEKVSTDWLEEYQDLGSAVYKMGRKL